MYTVSSGDDSFCIRSFQTVTPAAPACSASTDRAATKRRIATSLRPADYAAPSASASSSSPPPPSCNPALLFRKNVLRRDKTALRRAVTSATLFLSNRSNFFLAQFSQHTPFSSCPSQPSAAVSRASAALPSYRRPPHSLRAPALYHSQLLRHTAPPSFTTATRFTPELPIHHIL